MYSCINGGWMFQRRSLSPPGAGLQSAFVCNEAVIIRFIISFLSHFKWLFLKETICMYTKRKFKRFLLEFCINFFFDYFLVSDGFRPQKCTFVRVAVICLACNSFQNHSMQPARAYPLEFRYDWSYLSSELRHVFASYYPSCFYIFTFKTLLSDATQSEAECGLVLEVINCANIYIVNIRIK